MNNKTILITGASGGIGLQSAGGLARQGANIVMVGRDKERTSQAVEFVKAQTGNEGESVSTRALESRRRPLQKPKEI